MARKGGPYSSREIVIPPSGDQPKILLRSRPSWCSWICAHCGRMHRISIDQLGQVIMAPCGRGPTAVELDVPGAH